MTIAACPGPCNRRYREETGAWRQALADYDPLDSAQERPERPGTIPWPGDPAWCGTCAASIGLALAQLDDLIALRKAPADGYAAAPATQRVSGTAGDASPSPACDDEAEAASLLTGWEGEYRRVRGWPPAGPRGELASVETTCIAWLAKNLPSILRSPFAREFGEEVMALNRELAGAAKAGVRTLRKPVRCPNPSCQLLTLTWTEGEANVYCQNPACRLVMSYREYEAETERLAAQVA